MSIRKAEAGSSDEDDEKDEEREEGEGTQEDNSIDYGEDDEVITDISTGQWVVVDYDTL